MSQKSVCLLADSVLQQSIRCVILYRPTAVTLVMKIFIESSLNPCDDKLGLYSLKGGAPVVPFCHAKMGGRNTTVDFASTLTPSFSRAGRDAISLFYNCRCSSSLDGSPWLNCRSTTREYDRHTSIFRQHHEQRASYAPCFPERTMKAQLNSQE